MRQALRSWVNTLEGVSRIMSYPNKADTLQILNDWHYQYDRITELWDGMTKAIGVLPEGLFSEAVWGLFDSYTKSISSLVGDKGGWLDWHYLENNMGANCMAAGYDGKTKPIKNKRDLCALIFESRERS